MQNSLFHPSTFFSYFGDIVQLDLPYANADEISKKLNNYTWVEYNKSKPGHNRYGLSLTSLDGGMSGEIDLSSILEYNRNNGTKFTEFDFFTKTALCGDIPEFSRLIDMFSESSLGANHIGRSHIIKMNKGGFFPLHRDGNRIEALHLQPFRIILPLCDISPNDHLIWLHDEKPIHLKKGEYYLVNTSKKHCVFSMCDDNMLVVFNILCSQASIKQFENILKTK